MARRILWLHWKYPALGLDSIYHILRRRYRYSRGRVHRMMKHLNVHSKRKNAYKSTTNSNHSYPVAPNLLARNFTANEPNQVWVGDITYIPTAEGWLYLAIVKDLCHKKIVGYAFSSRIDTALTLTALRMAHHREKPGDGLIFHSDRGSQYAASAYRHELETCTITQSMSRKGDPYDNAVAENFFSCLKCELVHLTHFNTRAQAQDAIFSYIECFYNSFRPHSAIGWLTPNDFAAKFFSSSAA